MKLPRALRIVEYENGRVTAPPWPFRYEDAKHADLRKLRKHYRLDNVVAGARTEFDKFVRVRAWVRSQWDHGWSFKDQNPVLPACNALDILQRAKEGIEFHCSYYSTVFVQACLSLGYQARRLSIQKDISNIPITQLHKETNIGHCVPEVWSNEYRKWVVMDPDLNAHYERDGVPLNAYEIRAEWLSGDWRNVDYIQGRPPQGPISNPKKYSRQQKKMWQVFTRCHTMDYYHRIAVEMRNDFLSSGQGCPRLAWADSLTPPQLVQHPSLAVRGARYAATLDELYWPINEVFIELSCAERAGGKPGPLLEVKLQTQTPGFQKFLVRIGRGKWIKKPEAFRWRLRPGNNVIRARSVNVCGVQGPESRITVRYRES